MPKLKPDTIWPSDEEDVEITKQAIEDGTNLTDEELAQFKPFEQADLPESLKKLVRGRPKISNPKISTTVRLDEDVITFFKAKGKGWQTRLNKALRSYMLTHK